MEQQEKLILVIDIGGSKFAVGFMRMSGELLCQKRYVWKNASPSSLITEVADKVHELYKHHPGYASHVVVAGMTLPGIADPKTGEWVSSGFMGVSHLQVAKPMETLLGIKVYVDNDCKACALAERYFGAGQGCDNYFYMTVSNGVGGAIFANGELYYGAAGRSGEIGCCVVEEDGRMSDEGTIRGNLEMYACGRGLVRNYLEAGGNAFYQGAPVDGIAIAQLAMQRDPSALKALELEGRYLGKGIAWICCLFDPEKVIIGGGLSMIYDLYRDKLLETFEKHFGAGDSKRVTIMPTPLGYWGALMGAGALAIRGMNGLPASIPPVP